VISGKPRPVTSNGPDDESSSHATVAGRLDLLPFPPLEMRELVGPTELESFDNPSRSPVYPWLPEEAYERVFDFGCGCGRVARQMILQQPSPRAYVGVDLHAGMIRGARRICSPLLVISNSFTTMYLMFASIRVRTSRSWRAFLRVTPSSPW
jgi:SAM-dependent methyltransferase